MDQLVTLLAVVGAAAAGALLGCVTGLVPGLHSNNVASALASAPSAALMVVAIGGADATGAPARLAVSAAIVACAAAGAVSSAVPGIFLGAPEGRTALAVLPGHRLLLAGRGREALALHVGAATTSLALSMLALLPLRWAMGPPLDLQARATGWLGPALLLGTAAMLGLEARRATGLRRRLAGWRGAAVALAIVSASALLGHLVVFADGALLATGGAGIGTLFVGLFGLPTLAWAVVDPPRDVASEVEGGSTPDATRGCWPVVLRGTAVGAIVGWFPGTSLGQATMLAVAGGDGAEGGRGEDLEGARRYVAGAAAVGAANVVFNMAALATLLRARSGAAVAVQGLMGWSEPPWTRGLLPAPEVAALLLAAAVGMAVAVPITLGAGRVASRRASALADRRLLLSLAALLVGACLLTGGPVALAVLMASVPLGLLPPALGLMRVHLMGAMTVPIALGLILGGG